jgi:hypothetical protein
MARTFNNSSAKSTFGTLRQEVYQSDYINNKKKSGCNKLLFATNKSNLIIGQYTKLNLSNVCTVSVGPPPSKSCEFDDCNPCNNSTTVKINPQAGEGSLAQVPFYTIYTIDPLGELFGRTPCGILNYTNSMVFNPTYV